MAAKTSWVDILVNGAVRDMLELYLASLGIKALTLCPMCLCRYKECGCVPVIGYMQTGMAW